MKIWWKANYLYNSYEKLIQLTIHILEYTMLAIQRKPVYNEVHMNLSLSMCAWVCMYLILCVCAFYNMQDYMDIYLTKESVYLLPNIVKQL